MDWSDGAAPGGVMKGIESFLWVVAALLLTGCSTGSRSTQYAGLNSAFTGDAVATPSAHQQVGACEHTDTSFNCVSVVEVYDGDTIFVDIPEFPPLFGKRIGVRVAGVDTPELRSRSACERSMGQEAKLVLETLLGKARRIDVVDVQRDKYFRILGTVMVDGQPVATELLRRRLAYPYHGEKKPRRDWCH